MAIETEIQLNVTSLIYPDNVDLSPKLSDSVYDIQTIKELVDKYTKLHNWDANTGVSITYSHNSLGDRHIVLNTNDEDVYHILEIALNVFKELYPDMLHLHDVGLVEDNVHIRQITVTR